MSKHILSAYVLESTEDLEKYLHTIAKVGLCTYSARGHDGRRPWKVLLRIVLGEEIPPGIVLGDPPGIPPGEDIAFKLE